MEKRVKTLAVVCLLLLTLPAAGETDVLSSVPSDAYGFAAVKSPQEIVDRFKALLPFLEEMVQEFKDPFAPVREILGDVDLTGPAAVIVPALQDFDEEEAPVVFLVSAADAQAVVASHKEMVAADAAELPDGVVKVTAKKEAGEDLYLAVKDDFVVVAFKPELAAEMQKPKKPFKVLPEVRQAYDQGKIVLQGDIKKMRPLMVQSFNEARAEVTSPPNEEFEEISPDEATANEFGLLSMDVVQSVLEQLDKLIFIIDVSQKGILYSQKIIFEADSPGAELINAHIGKGEPSYKSIPAGTFILAGAAKIAPGQLDVLTDVVLAKAKNYPRLQEKLNEESSQKLISDIRATYGQFSGMAFTANMGSPATGMLNFVGRFDVVDAASFKEQIKKVCQGELASTLTKSTGIELVYNDAAESYAGVDIDTITLKTAQIEQNTEVTETAGKVMQAMPMVIGPDMSIRIVAPTDNQVLIIIGGGYARAERVINVANGYGSNLDNYAKIIEAKATMPANRITEMHQDFGVVFNMMKNFVPDLPANFPGPGMTTLPLVSISCSLETNSLRCDGNLAGVSLPVAILIPAVMRAREAANMAVCATNLKGLDTALYLYANTYDDKYPDASRWREVLIEEDLAPLGCFICPSVDGDPEKDNDYVFVPWPGPIEADEDLLGLFEKKGNHYGYRNVCTVSHGVMKVDEAQFQEMLTKTIEALKAKGIEFNWQE